jgi:hypothetical protein
MIESINNKTKDLSSISSPLVNKPQEKEVPLADESKETKAATEIKVINEDGVEKAVSPDGDTAEITDEGKSKAASMPKSSSISNSTDRLASADTSSSTQASNNIDSLKDPSKKPAASDKDSSVSTSNLAQYTEAQLSNMVSKGIISRFEYNKEIESRLKVDENVS